ncbi:sulfate transporter [Planctomycetia bacterium]|jgi:MFS superfamily sulfate permease-like transporter|nr:sulfate transporter [Planctomycetia bacterium]
MNQTTTPVHAGLPGGDVPQGTPAGFRRYLRHDLASGFLVFLIALPLCLGISLASGFPPVAGVFTAIVGAIVTTFLSNSELTIKGPAAGLIVIALGAMHSFGFDAGLPLDAPGNVAAYRMTLAVGCAAGLLQVGFGLLRVGALSEFFPTAVVHGMLAAIGFIICLKQLPVVFGQKAAGEPLEILRELPEKIAHLNPQITVIGLVSLGILFGFPLVRPLLRPAWLRMLPAQLLVLALAVPLGMWFDLAHDHTYSFLGHEYKVGAAFLVSVPANLAAAVTTPDFGVFTTASTRLAGAWWVVMFALVGSVESLLSAKAIDLLDPWKRKTDMNRDLLAVGVANVAAAAVGGLPMISEIVRSKANIDNGARTRFADLWHGLFLLAFVALVPWAIHRIPLAALAAMLVYTGFRLASPREFINVFKIGSEQLLIFVATIVGVLATDLLVGVGIGIGLKFLIHAINGVPLRSFFKPFLKVTTIDDRTVQIDAGGSAVFSNWIPFRRQIVQLGLGQGHDVIVNLAGARVVDSSVMEKLEDLGHDFEQAGLALRVIGLDSHRGSTAHPHATRRRMMTRLRRLTVVAEAGLEPRIVERFRDLGASGYTAMPCHGSGRSHPGAAGEPLVRIEAIVPAAVAEQILDAIQGEFAPLGRITVCTEMVEVLRPERF